MNNELHLSACCYILRFSIGGFVLDLGFGSTWSEWWTYEGISG